MNTLDVTGLSCPEPAMRTKSALQGLPSGEELVVVADTGTARDNIERIATQLGCAVAVDQKGDQFSLTITKP